MNTVKWLLLGAGDIAQKRVAPALAAAQHSELVGVCDVRRDQAAALAQKHGAGEVFTDAGEALKRTAADAVYVATPVWLHAPQAELALAAGKHTLVEKPLGLTAEEAERLVRLAGRAGRKSGCAYFRRCSPRYIQARGMVERGEFGQIVLVRMVYFSWFNPDPADPKYWRVIKAKSGGGPLSDMGTHMFDVLIGLFGMPRRVYAQCGNLVHRWEVEDSAVLLMTLAGGAQVTASFNWNSKTWRHEFEMVGTEAKLAWLPYDSGPVVKAVGRTVENLDLPGAENVHLPLVQDFVDAILADRDPVCPLAEAAKTNALLDAVYRSAAEAREVCVTP